ncbi:2,3-bisphosphoglycerate-independent phosphoglycerate mutase [Anaerotignum faecicola]
MEKKTTVLMILDGFGLNDKAEGNAVKLAKTPVLDGLMQKYPFVEGYASGLDVGLPAGQMGNSEVGHLNMGAGRVVYQELTRITKAIEDGDFFENPTLLEAVEHCKKNNSALHLYGLLSDGGVHSHNTHLYALLQLAKRNDLEKVYVHVFLDGRDTPPTSGAEYAAQLEEKMREIGVGKIATVMGRYYAMDRDKRWERVQEAYNFRPDRAREITRSLCDPDFDGFQRESVPQDLKYICFTEYDVTIPNKEVAFKPQKLKNTLGEYISSLGLKQLRTAETEKYAHVTFFFNGGVEEPNPNEDRWLVPSPKVATYDLQPEMSAVAVTDGLVTVDACVGRVVDALLAVNGQMFICADHGNSDQMIDYETGQPFTAHTTNPVPFILVNYTDGVGLREGGKLADIAPTLLEMMGLPKPAEMTGTSLLTGK